MLRSPLIMLIPRECRLELESQRHEPSQSQQSWELLLDQSRDSVASSHGEESGVGDRRAFLWATVKNVQLSILKAGTGVYRSVEPRANASAINTIHWFVTYRKSYLICQRLDRGHIQEFPTPKAVNILFQIHWQVIKDQVELSIFHDDVQEPVRRKVS